MGKTLSLTAATMVGVGATAHVHVCERMRNLPQRRVRALARERARDVCFFVLLVRARARAHRRASAHDLELWGEA